MDFDRNKINVGNKLLLLGDSGKMGIALRNVFENDYSIVGKNTSDFDAFDFRDVKRIIEEEEPDIVINTVAFLGIDPCEKEPEKAFRLNTLYPKLLAELSNKEKFLLIHFSTDAVFNDQKGDYYTEKDIPMPVNLYGFTKYGADCFIQSISKNYYIFRVSVLFGETEKNTQFVEKMIQLVIDKRKILKISDDIISSPTYSKDVAREIKRMLKKFFPFGLYHLSNSGKGSLFDIMHEIVTNLNLEVEVTKASYRDFPFIGKKNTNTPIRSLKIRSLRPWKEAIKEYCNSIESKKIRKGKK
ncbi:SDR family oxidoreductase [Thermodesulfobacteriota bacterium]